MLYCARAFNPLIAVAICVLEILSAIKIWVENADIGSVKDNLPPSDLKNGSFWSGLIVSSSGVNNLICLKLPADCKLVKENFIGLVKVAVQADPEQENLTLMSVFKS